MKPIERIALFIHFKKITPHAFEQKIDLSNGYFSKQLKHLGSVGSDILIKIHQAYPELDILWILTGEGQMLKEAVQQSQQIDEIILEDFTNHTPVIMLFLLVCLAALLIPLHHKLEKWATNKLIKKNIKVRLAKAKKTITALEEETN